MRLAASALASVACAVIGYVAGDHQRDNAWRAAQARAERDASVRYRAEVDRGQKAALAYAAVFTDLSTRFTTLQAQFHEVSRRIPFTVPAAPARPVQPAVARPAGALASTPPPSAISAAEAASQVPTVMAPLVPGSPVDRSVLSAGAVWMWNSALAGIDVPSAACRATDTSEPACAAGTGIRLEDAWDNHATNARSCAEDRLRHARLIDYLNARH